MTAFRDLFSAHVASPWARLREFDRLVGGRSWAVDLDTGIATFGGDLSFPIQLVGTEAYGDNSWLWAWANTESDLPQKLLRLVTSVREFGEQHGILELTEESASLSNVRGDALSLLCGGLTGGQPFYRGAYDGGALYFLVEKPPQTVTAPLPPERIPTVLSEVISTFEVDHRSMVESFLERHGFATDRRGTEVTAQAPDGSSCRIEFDSQGRVERMDFRLKPKPA